VTRFSAFLEERTEEERNVRDTLKSVPTGHADLVKGYKFHFQTGNTLDGDDQHVGIIDPKVKKVTIAGPWSYGREHVLLHELGHLVYFLLDEKTKKSWKKLIKKVKHGLDSQGAEEVFAHCYAGTYSQNKLKAHSKPEWEAFIKNLPEEFAK
jgi:hypothetical protein